MATKTNSLIKCKLCYAKTLFAFMLTLWCTQTTFAYQIEANGIYYNTNGNTASVTYKTDAYNSYSGVVHIPEKVEYAGEVYAVTSVGSNAFRNCENLVSVTIPTSVTVIDDYAFYKCSGLTEIIIPENVENINAYAFQYCTGLTEITIPNSVNKIMYGAFRDCGTLTTVTIADGADELKLYTQTYYSEYGPFYNCKIENLFLGRNVSYSSSYSPFYNLTLKKAIIGKNVTSINSIIFERCFDMKELIILDSPNSISLPSSFATQIEKRIEKLYLGRNIEYSIEWGSSLNTLEIGEGLTSIRSDDFINCNGFNIISHAAVPPTLDGDLNAISLETPLQASCQYARSEYWKDIEHIYAMKDSVKYYPVVMQKEGDELVTINGAHGDIEVAENGMAELKTIMDMENGYYVTHGGYDVTKEVIREKGYTFTVSATHRDNIVKTGAFPVTNVALFKSGTLLDAVGAENVYNVQHLKISGDINGTDILTIRRMTALRLLDLEDANIVAGGMAYYNDYTTSDNEIGSYIFQDKENLLKVVLPKTVTTINEYAFSGMADLVSVTIPQSVVKIGSYAFKDCVSIESVILEDGDATLDFSTYIFDSCPLRYLYMGRNIAYTSADSPFGSKKLLKTLTVSSSVTSIGKYAFFGCSGLTEVGIGRNVKSIGDYAFNGCSSIASIMSYATTPPEITDYTFDETTEKTATLHVPVNGSIYWLSPYWRNFADIKYDIEESIEEKKEKAEAACEAAMEVYYRYMPYYEGEGMAYYKQVAGKQDENANEAEAIFSNIEVLEKKVAESGLPEENIASLLASLNTVKDNVSALNGENGEVFAGNSFHEKVNENYADITAYHDRLVQYKERIESLATASELNELIAEIGKDSEDTEVSCLTPVVNEYQGLEGIEARLDEISEKLNACKEQIQSLADETDAVITGIVNVTDAETEYTTVYTLSGQQYTVRNTELKSLPKGIYIVNGKKVIIK